MLDSETGVFDLECCYNSSESRLYRGLFVNFERVLVNALVRR